MAKFTLENTFHGTTATVILPELGGKLSASQQRRVERALCGIDGCECGTVRPGDRQDCVCHTAENYENGRILYTVRPRR